MTTENQVVQTQETKTNDKELNFRALEAKYQRELEKERAARIEAERIAQERIQMESQEDDDNNTDPYINDKRLNKKLAKFGQATQTDIQKAMEKAKIAAKEELKREIWLENNPDFYDILQNNADKLMYKDPNLAKSILEMPDTFERQKLVYNNIKALGLDKPEVKQSSIQEKVDANRRGPYYQPSGMGAAPYAAAGDFSEAGKKQAHAKMQELKSRLRI